MERYKKEIELYFELRDTPQSSRESYLRRICAFLDFAQNTGHKSPPDITHTDIQQYILYLKKEKGLSAGTINNYISGIRLFYTHILGNEWDSKKILRMKRAHVFPVIPPKEYLLEILDATTNLKHKAIFSLIYGSGLRVGEVVKLRISDICSKTMRVRVENAKHNTNRYTILSQASLDTLRKYFRAYFAPGTYGPHDWLFPGREKGRHIHIKTVKNTIIKIRDRLQLDQRISAHTLRHCFATHALEDGVRLVHIQHLLGHKSIKSTSVYLHMTSKSIMGIKSPLDTGSGGQR